MGGSANGDSPALEVFGHAAARAHALESHARHHKTGNQEVDIRQVAGEEIAPPNT